MRAALALMTGLLAGCDLSMKQQPRHATLSSATLWPDGAAVQAPPDGAVARDAPALAAAADTPPTMTPALLERGRERYAVDCAMCHGTTGVGDGAIVRRGFPAPQPFAAPGQRALPAARIVAVITNGVGTMYGHADRVAPADRWAIAAYVKALGRLPEAAAR